MVACIEQYCNYHLYIYTRSEPMRDHGNDDDCCQQQHYANVYTSAAYLQWSNIACVANCLQQWHHRNMVTGVGQYNHYHLYIYA